MAEWEKPETLTTEEIVAFLRNEHAMHGIGFGYNNGVGVVAGVYEEAARRLLRAERALKHVIECDTTNLMDVGTNCVNAVVRAKDEYNGGGNGR